MTRAGDGNGRDELRRLRREVVELQPTKRSCTRPLGIPISPTRTTRYLLNLTGGVDFKASAITLACIQRMSPMNISRRTALSLAVVVSSGSFVGTAAALPAGPRQQINRDPTFRAPWCP